MTSSTLCAVPAIAAGIAGLPTVADAGTMTQRAGRVPQLPVPPAGPKDFFDSGRKGQAGIEW